MKLKITEDCMVNGEHTEAGTEVDLPLPQANQLLMSGRAEAVDPSEAIKEGALISQDQVREQRAQQEREKNPREGVDHEPRDGESRDRFDQRSRNVDNGIDEPLSARRVVDHPETGNPTDLTKQISRGEAADTQHDPPTEIHSPPPQSPLQAPTPGASQTTIPAPPPPSSHPGNPPGGPGNVPATHSSSPASSPPHSSPAHSGGSGGVVGGATHEHSTPATHSKK